jgi:hypothetical protein
MRLSFVLKETTSPSMVRYGGSKGDAFPLKQFYERLGLPSSVPLYSLGDVVGKRRRGWC